MLELIMALHTHLSTCPVFSSLVYIAAIVQCKDSRPPLLSCLLTDIDLVMSTRLYHAPDTSGDFYVSFVCVGCGTLKAPHVCTKAAGLGFLLYHTYSR